MHLILTYIHTYYDQINLLIGLAFLFYNLIQENDSINSILILDYVKRFATEEALRESEQAASSDSESSMSDFSEDEAQDMEL